LAQRFHALDVFRGATVCLMILVNNPGSWGHVYPPLEHAPWHGLTPTDLVFPFFLFAVGNALSFVMPRLYAGGDKMFWEKITRRSVIIFAIGLFLQWWPFMKWTGDHLVFRYWVDPADPETGVRVLGVLQRIALCYFFASILIYYLRPRGAFYVGLTLLLIYWLACYIGNPSDPYSLPGWFGTKVDKAVLHVPHMYKGEGIPFDPEGIISTLPAIVEVIFGYLVGDYIQKKSKVPIGLPENQNAIDYGPYPMLSGLFVAAVAMLVTGYCWAMVLPINKKIWTSSYTIYTSGLATITIATMTYFIEYKGVRGWLSRFFDVFGKNALFVFALSAFLPRTLALIRIPDHVNDNGQMVYFTPWNWLYQRVLIYVPGDPRIGSLLYAICVITFMWAICYWLDRRRIYIKV
jgi:predicted acyltransferase